MPVSMQLDEMSIEEKIRTMESLWEDLRARAPDSASPAWHGDILAGRAAAVERGEDHFEDWGKARKKIKARLS